MTILERALVALGVLAFLSLPGGALSDELEGFQNLWRSLDLLDKGGDAYGKAQDLLDIAFPPGLQTDEAFAEVSAYRSRLRRHKVEDVTVPMNVTLEDVMSSDPRTRREALARLERWVADTEESVNTLQQRRDKYRDIYARFNKASKDLSRRSQQLDALVNDKNVARTGGDTIVQRKAHIDFYMTAPVADIKGLALGKV